LKDHTHNTVSALLVGDAIPAERRGTELEPKSKKGFTHYSILSTVERDWDLRTLGRADGNAEPFWGWEYAGGNWK
jgi:hypothetical protein